MKQCPSCHKNYADETLNFCLDDGQWLAGVAADGSPTEILSSTALSGESPTTAFDAEIGTPKDAGYLSHRVFRSRWLPIAAIVVLIPAAYFAYKYFIPDPGRQIESIAVMPFVNESGNTDIEYLSDGMTETLISSLSRLPNLNVKARSSVFRYKGRETNLQTLGKELNVQALLYGRVVQRGQDLILNVELIDAQTENVLWSENYNRPLASLVVLRNDITRDVSAKLRTKLSGLLDEQTLAKNDTANPEAYRLYLEGRFFWNKRRIGEMGKAISFFQQAIAADPNYARAFAGLADAVSQPSDVVPHSEREKRSKDAVYKALSLNPDLAEAHAALAHILTRYNLDFANAELGLRRALELDPKWVDTYQRYGELYTVVGRHEEALAKYREGLEIEPFNISLNGSYGAALMLARRYDESIAQFEKTKEMDANFRNVRVGVSVAYWMKGMYAKSVEDRVKALELADQHQFAARIRESFADRGWQGYLEAERDRYRTVERTIDRSSYYTEAIILTALGEKDKAFAVLNKSLEANEKPALVFLKVEPRLDPLRDDPRFQELLKKVSFPQ